jgi:ubiquinone/menaquinone biosynthesis C-methylase UbiE
MNYFDVETQQIKIESDLLYDNEIILDIGGGGEGVISKAFPKRTVIAIDSQMTELMEANSTAIKIEMDATDMKFAADNFKYATAFFSFMYMSAAKRKAAIQEIHRVLQKNGQLVIWDSVIDYQANDSKYDAIIINLKITLPNNVKISTGYGVPYTADYALSKRNLVDDAEKIGFEILENRNIENTLFFLRLKKQ